MATGRQEQQISLAIRRSHLADPARIGAGQHFLRFRQHVGASDASQQLLAIIAHRIHPVPRHIFQQLAQAAGTAEGQRGGRRFDRHFRRRASLDIGRPRFSNGARLEPDGAANRRGGCNLGQQNRKEELPEQAAHGLLPDQLVTQAVHRLQA